LILLGFENRLRLPTTALSGYNNTYFFEPFRLLVATTFYAGFRREESSIQVNIISESGDGETRSQGTARKV
jgi:hypothetical protein